MPLMIRFERDREALALQLDLNHLEDQISDTGSEIRDLTERIDSIQSWLERGYQYCPNRKPYSECTHTREKNQYIADRNEKRSSKEQYQQRVEDLDKLLNDLYEGAQKEDTRRSARPVRRPMKT